MGSRTQCSYKKSAPANRTLMALLVKLPTDIYSSKSNVGSHDNANRPSAGTTRKESCFLTKFHF